MDTINVDYIGVVKTTTDGRTLFTKEPIDNEYQELLGTLDDMVSNPNMTVLDMKSHFNIVFRNAQRGYDYCFPYSYSASFIHGANYPTSPTFEEYHTELNKSSDKCETAKSLKLNYKKEAIRYIQALCYYKKLQQLRQDDKNRMFSSENIGWTSYVYDINSDMQFQLNTNFGYGYSSYFFLNLTYKGVDILPYSMSVSYYYANMLDIIRYTRMYEACRNSWNIAFDFVTKTSNEAIINPTAFIHHWIIDEIQMMIAGLKRFAENPTESFKSLLYNKSTEGLITVRNISNSEINDYKIYSHEMEIAKQAEKISGALKFLTNLESLSKLFPEISDYIQVIKDININLLPSFERNIHNINKNIENRQLLVTSLEEELADLNKFCKPHNEIILKIKQNKEAETGKFIPEYQMREEYFKEHTNYKEMYEKAVKVQESIDTQKNDIWKRKNFMSEIQSCVDEIRKTLLISA